MLTSLYDIITLINVNQNPSFFIKKVAPE